jgi:nitroimidazol reductase NimA-like FMN-containing flavoprotein (pyridoxamine 5'-phosphate oxidase superfamily)
MLIEDMSAEDSLALLTRAGFGRLGCAHENQPYVVPIYYACNNRTLYGFATFGQKIRWMRANPLVCVEADELDVNRGWRSVIVFGRYEELSDVPEWDLEREHARALLEKRYIWSEPAAITSTHRGGSYDVWYRIRIERLTGFRAILGPSMMNLPLDVPIAHARNRFLRLLRRKA